MKKTIAYAIIGCIFLSLIGCKQDLPSALPVVKEQYFKQAQEAVDKGDMLLARDLYKKEMEQTENTIQLAEIKMKIETLNMKIMTSPIIDEYSEQYIVQPKDSLFKIAKKYQTTPELIMQANGMATEIILPDQKLKINACPLSIAVDKSQNVLFLKRKGEVVKTYIVSTGKDNSTPIGTFKIVNKIMNPTWYKTGAAISPDNPENVLGTRWMGISLKGYGIHGTIEPDKLGMQVTAGCVRMKNEDVEELYNLVPAGTEVTIVD